MTETWPGIAVDPGTAVIKITADDPADPAAISTGSAGTPRDVMSAALAAARLPGPPGRVCLAVPEAWLDGSAGGVRAQEAMRHACQDELGIAHVTWVGQLTAAAALAARQRGPGRYLVCDIGARGVRAAAFDVTGPVIRITATDTADGGGWHDFDTAVRSWPPAAGEPLPADWYLAAAGQDRRARAVLEQAAIAAGYEAARVYTLTGPHGRRDLVAGQLIDSFAATRHRLSAGISKVLRGGPADVAVLIGGLSWFPLAASVVSELARVRPLVLGPDAAVRGALLFARDEARAAPPPDPGPVTLSLHQIKGGLLEQVDLVLPWNEPFVSPPDGPLMLDNQDLVLGIGNRLATVKMPELAPGPYQIGVRLGWSGSAALVARPVGSTGEPIVRSLDPMAAR